MWTSSADEASDGRLGDAMKNSGSVMILRSQPFSDDRGLRSWPSSDVFDLSEWGTESVSCFCQ